MRIAVLGAGALGLAVAAKLSTVAEVHAVARERHAREVRERGLGLSGLWGEGRFPLPCAEDLPGGEFDLFLITSKSNDTEAICERFADRIRGREVASLQNGIGNEEIVSGYTDRVMGGRVITGFEWRGAAEIRVTVEAAPIRLGRFPSGSDAAVEEAVATFVRAGLRAEVSREVRTDIWAKALYNCLLNPLGALMGVPYGELDDVNAWRMMEHLAEEVFAVAEAEGVRMPWRDHLRYLEHLREDQLPITAAHRSSMLQDIERGRRTEVDFLNGAVSAMGRARGIPVPYNDMMTDLIRFKESLSPGRGRR